MRTPGSLDGIPKYKIFPEIPISCGAEVSRFEIGGDKPCSRHLSGKYDAKRRDHFLQADLSGVEHRMAGL